jgi:aryl-alcohol dehydrogenase-like predicted oxidoreductase
MNYRALGGTGLTVSEIGFGTWGLGGDNGGAVAYGPADDEESIRALQHAVECGINFFDTADLYGFGHSEDLLGQAFRGKRDKVILCTKAGLISVDGKQDFSKEHLQKALNGSLRRLRTDYVDVFLLHNPPIDLLDQDSELIPFLEELKRSGKFKAWGVSLRSPQDGLKAVEHFHCPVIQTNFNLTDQRARQNGLLDLCARQNTGCVIRTPLCFGFLTGHYSENPQFDPSDHRRRWSIEQRQQWTEASRAFNAAVTPISGQTPAQVALRFCLSYSGVSTTIPGMLISAHVDDNAGSGRLGPMAPGERQRLEQEYEQRSFFLSAQRPAQQSARP